MVLKQAPSSIFMVRPAQFGYNSETAVSNSFQQKSDADPAMVRQQAKAEFDTMVATLRENKIDTMVFEDTEQPIKPDAVFPNNWISIHEDGKLFLYPMLTENRRKERREDIIDAIKNTFAISSVIDLSTEAANKKILEGTGSIVFDHVNKIAYASRSERTNEELLQRVCTSLGYQFILFDAVDQQGRAIYHTNVLLTVGTKFAVICLDAIHSDEDLDRLLGSFEKTEHKVIAISYAQMNAFAGNMIEVKNTKAQSFVLLSQTAYSSLLPGQIKAIELFAKLLPLSIPTIERYGGGSVRCMVAGIHAGKK